jgi:hypothetical protein
MTRLQKLLALVARRRANGAPEEVINRTLEDNGYSRARFEEAVRKSIEREVNAKPDQFGAFVEGLKKNSVGVARDLVAVPLMEWGDELEAGARALLGEDYDQTVGKIRAERQQFAEEQPGLSTAATASGFAAPFLPKQRIPGTGASFSPAKVADPAGEALIAGTGKLGLNYRAGQPAVENIPRTAAQGAMVAGPAGVTTAAGMSEPDDEGSPLGAGIIGTMGGALVNPAMSAMIGKAAPYVQEGYQRFFGGGQPPIPPGGAAGAASPPEPPRMGLGDPELETALRRMKDDGLTVAQMKARQQEAKDLGYTNTIYPDLGEEGVLKQTRAIVNKSPEAATLADQFLRPRQEQMASRIGQRSDEMIAPGVSPFQQSQAQEVIRDTEAPMLNIIREDPIDAQAILEPINRNPAVRQELETRRAINAMRRPDTRRPDYQGELEDQITVPLQTTENARSGIDVVAQRYDGSQAAKDKDALGVLSEIREDLYTATNHPVYRELMKTRENTYKIEEAAVAGAEAFSNKSADEIELQMSLLAPDELAAYKAAFVSALKNQINRVARGTNVSRKLNNQNVEDQLRALFQGDGEAFKRYYDGVRTQETRMARTYGQVKGNSTTASQLDEMNSLGKVQDVFDALGVAAYPAPTRENFGTLTRLLSRATDPSEKIASNLGQVYFDPSKTDDFLDLLDRYSTRRDELMQILARQSGRPLSLGTRSLLSGDE